MLIEFKSPYEETNYDKYFKSIEKSVNKLYKFTENIYHKKKKHSLQEKIEWITEFNILDYYVGAVEDIIYAIDSIKWSKYNLTDKDKKTAKKLNKEINKKIEKVRPFFTYL
jgi:uncharacterized protein YoxC